MCRAFFNSPGCDKRPMSLYCQVDEKLSSLNRLSRIYCVNVPITVQDKESEGLNSKHRYVPECDRYQGMEQY